ncbi:MAG: hypothetical protein KDJ65_06910, partial [Anaerolineae bacterium]|nr:hypothetical protein [Anaerolineae bacterium]
RAKSKQTIQQLLESSEAHLEREDLEAAREKNEKAQNLLSTLMTGADLRDLKDQIGRQEKKIIRVKYGVNPNQRYLDVFRELRGQGEMWDRALWFMGTSTDIISNQFVFLFRHDLLYLASRYRSMPRDLFVKTVMRFNARGLMEYTEMYIDFLREIYTTKLPGAHSIAAEFLDEIWKTVHRCGAEPEALLDMRLSRAIGQMKAWNRESRAALW